MQSEERFGLNTDLDGDGLANELTVADLTAVSMYQATLPVPGRVIPNDPALERAILRGEAVFGAKCDRVSKVVADPARGLKVPGCRRARQSEEMATFRGFLARRSLVLVQNLPQSIRSHAPGDPRKDGCRNPVGFEPAGSLAENLERIRPPLLPPAAPPLIVIPNYPLLRAAEQRVE